MINTDVTVHIQWVDLFRLDFVCTLINKHELIKLIREVK